MPCPPPPRAALSDEAAALREKAALRSQRDADISARAADLHREGMSTTEIAQRLGISKPTVRKRLQEAGLSGYSADQRYNHGLPRNEGGRFVSDGRPLRKDVPRNEVRKSAGEALRAWLESTGRTQAQLGRELGVGRVAVSRWCNGHDLPSPLVAVRLAALTGEHVPHTWWRDARRNLGELAPAGTEAKASRPLGRPGRCGCGGPLALGRPVCSGCEDDTIMRGTLPLEYLPRATP